MMQRPLKAHTAMQSMGNGHPRLPYTGTPSLHPPHSVSTPPIAIEGAVCVKRHEQTDTARRTVPDSSSRQRLEIAAFPTDLMEFTGA